MKEDNSGPPKRFREGTGMAARIPDKEDMNRQGLFGGDAEDLWNTRHGEIAGPGADKVNMHPEPGLERNGKTKEENKEDA
jgi:hypothetical protein